MSIEEHEQPTRPGDARSRGAQVLGGSPLVDDAGRAGAALPPIIVDRRRSSVRATLVTLAVVTGWFLAIIVIFALRRVLTWTVVGGFFAVVLTPLVDRLERKLHLRRGVAVGLTVLGTLAGLAGVVAAFIVPVAQRAPSIATDFPSLVDQAAQGRGRVGEVLQRLHLVQWVRDHELEINRWINNLGSRSVGLITSAFSGILAGVTILVLCVFFLLYGPHLCAAVDDMVPHRHRERVRLVSADAARAMSGYMLGNFLISLIAGTAAFVALVALGVPYAVVLAAWVAFADLIPLVGATMGAIPGVLIAFLHSTWAGVGALIFFVLYQQFENSVIQVAVMRRTVKVNSLTVILSVLAGVELFGFLGAFLAIPAAGVIQLVVREVSVFRSQRRLLRP